MRKMIFMMTAILLVVLSSVSTTNGRINSKTLFDDVDKMTTEEIVAEMKYAVSTGKNGKYFPQDRMHALEKQLAKNQTAEIERFKNQLKADAKIAKQIEDLKQKAIDKAKEKGNEYYEKNKDKIQAEVENQARKALKMSQAEWQVRKDEINEMYKQGSEAYEEHVQGYVEAAQKAYDAYNAYNKAKSDHPEAPDAAQNLVGFLNATGEVLNYAGDKMDKTPLRPIGEILKLYGAATDLGNTAAKNAWAYTHREGINPNVQSQYSKGLAEVGLSDGDYGGLEKSNIMMHDKNIRILKLANGNYAVFNDKFEIVPGATGKQLTPDEYKKLEQLYTAFSNAKEDGWPDLNAEQLAKLARGDKVKVTVDDNMWPFSDEIKEFDASKIEAMGESHGFSTINSELTTSLDRILNGDQTFFGGLVDPFTKYGRRDEIREMLNMWRDSRENYNSYIHEHEAFLEWVKAIKEQNKDLTPEELKAKIKDMLKNGENPEEDQEDKDDKDDKSDPDDKNPLVEELQEIDPNVEDADASGVKKDDKKDDKDSDSSSGDDHWTNQTPEEFNGTKDGGFTNTGGTHRPMPGGGNPQAIGIPVLKPNIYLYPEETTEICVQFKYPWLLTTVIPDYVSSWNVEARPDGLLDDQYGFLFYESIAQPIFFQKELGWKVPAKERTDVFEEILYLYGFNVQEKIDFVEFWNDRLEQDVNYVMYPQETATIDLVMPVVIQPSPASIHRIWFYFIPDYGMTVTEPEQVETISRQGLTVVEWGGMYE